MSLVSQKVREIIWKKKSNLCISLDFTKCKFGFSRLLSSKIGSLAAVGTIGVVKSATSSTGSFSSDFFFMKD